MRALADWRSIKRADLSLPGYSMGMQQRMEGHLATATIVPPITLRLQPDDITCGPSCVAMVAHSVGRASANMDIRKLGEHVGTDNKTGTPPSRLRHALESLGVEHTHGYYDGVENLKQYLDGSQGRVILRTVTHGIPHWVIADRVQDGNVVLLDPWLGVHQATEDIIRERCEKTRFEAFTIPFISGWPATFVLSDRTWEASPLSSADLPEAMERYGPVRPIDQAAAPIVVGMSAGLRKRGAPNLVGVCFVGAVANRHEGREKEAARIIGISVAPSIQGEAGGRGREALRRYASMMAGGDMAGIGRGEGNGFRARLFSDSLSDPGIGVAERPHIR